MTFAQDILTEAGDEPILAISLSPNRKYWRGDDAPPSDHPLGTDPVSWEEALPYLSYEYHNGHGGQDCHNIWAWTATRVLSIHEYDGATWVISVPRSPEAAVGLQLEDGA